MRLVKNVYSKNVNIVKKLIFVFVNIKPTWDANPLKDHLAGPKNMRISQISTF